MNSDLFRVGRYAALITACYARLWKAEHSGWTCSTFPWPQQAAPALPPAFQGRLMAYIRACK